MRAAADIDRESWTSWDGRDLIERRPSTGRVEYDVIDDPAPPSYADPTPEFAATLPDTAERLLAFLDPRVGGSTTHEKASTRSTDELSVDRSTGQVLATHEFSEQFDFRATTQTGEVVGGVPAALLPRFESSDR